MRCYFSTTSRGRATLFCVTAPWSFTLSSALSRNNVKCSHRLTNQDKPGFSTCWFLSQVLCVLLSGAAVERDVDGKS